MTYQLDICISATHPMEAVSTLGDLVYLIDDIAAEFSSKQYIEEGDLPLIITYQGEHTIDPITRRPFPSTLSLTNVGWVNAKVRVPDKRPEFLIGDLVRHSFTGIQYEVRASAYYDVNKAYKYLLFNPADDMADLFAATHIMTEDLFCQIPTMLWNVTGKLWYWNSFQGIFECDSNKSRKMRPRDAINTWKMDFENQEVPF